MTLEGGIYNHTTDMWFQILSIGIGVKLKGILLLMQKKKKTMTSNVKILRGGLGKEGRRTCKR